MKARRETRERGLLFDGTQLFRQGAGEIGGAPEPGDHFGAALAAFDVNDDGFDDLVIGVPDEDLGSVVDAGLVLVLHGSPSGLTTNGQYGFLDEPDETIVLSLANPSAGLALGTPSTLTITIVDDDVAGALQFSATTYQVGESAALAQVTVTRTGGAASGVTVEYETFEAGGGSATPGEDYVPVDGALTFDASQTSRTFTVPILGDRTDEPSETIVLKILAPGGGGTLGTPTQAALTITDDDPAGQVFFDDFESGDASFWSAAVGGS
jgi:hypothetical protein